MEEVSSMELFEETKIKITKLHAIENVNIEDYQNWFEKFFVKISTYA